MDPPPDLQPDQQPRRWDAHVAAYEEVFEPLTNRFAEAALGALALSPGDLVVDVGAGSGGAALMAAEQGAEVVAIDAAPAMAARIRARANGRPIHPAAMDAAALALAESSFAAGLSVFGIILCPDPVAALAEMRRVLVPGGRAAVVTWTEPERYELVVRLLSAVGAVRGAPQSPPPTRPAQLRFAAEADFRRLFSEAGMSVERIERVEASLRAPSARFLGERLSFAPGLAAMLDGLGPERERVVSRFVADLERDGGEGPVALRAVAFVGLATG